MKSFIYTLFYYSAYLFLRFHGWQVSDKGIWQLKSKSEDGTDLTTSSTLVGALSRQIPFNAEIDHAPPHIVALTLGCALLAIVVLAAVVF